jgi:diadenosine hexaphosphate hydrolase (ATP-forming)
MSTHSGVVRDVIGEIIKAGCVVIDLNKLLLVCDSTKTIYSFPKGHVEVGETPKEAALRETLEETGYKVEIISQLPDVVYKNGETDDAIRVNMFLAKPVEKIADHGDQISEWVDIDRAKELLYPNLVQLMDNL